jgi:hypothetical protein
MSMIRIFTISAAVFLGVAFTFAADAAFANAPGGGYIQCDSGRSSPVSCTPDSW